MENFGYSMVTMGVIVLTSARHAVVICRMDCKRFAIVRMLVSFKIIIIIIIIINLKCYDYTNNNCSHWNSNEKLKEKFGSCTRKTFGRFITKDSYTWNITHNTESTAV